MKETIDSPVTKEMSCNGFKIYMYIYVCTPLKPRIIKYFLSSDSQQIYLNHLPGIQHLFIFMFGCYMSQNGFILKIPYVLRIDKLKHSFGL